MLQFARLRKMDRQNRVGSKPGSGGVASVDESNIERRERLRKLALETIDLSRDPYFLKNHLGSFECKLCLTIHPSEGSYLAHTQGKKHQMNLSHRALKESKEGEAALPAHIASARKVTIRKVAVKIGRPGYKITKVKDPASRQFGLLFQIQYPEIVADKPRHRFMSAFEQKVEPPSKMYQYLLFAAAPYENIAFKVQSREIDRDKDKLWSHWDADSKTYTMQFFFKEPF